MSKPVADLGKALGLDATETDFLDALDAGAQQQLLADIDQAREEHRRHIREALQEALNHVPRLLRGPLKKLFGA